jgi:hypothetical protein
MLHHKKLDFFNVIVLILTQCEWCVCVRERERKRARVQCFHHFLHPTVSRDHLILQKYVWIGKNSQYPSFEWTWYYIFLKKNFIIICCFV